MTEHLVIVFAYHYPPENAIGADRPFRFAKYLARLGYTCQVFTAAPQADRSDPNVQYVPDPFFTHPRGSSEWQVERAIRKFILPGALGTQWAYRAYQAAQAFLRKHSRANVTVFSTFPPLGAQLAAWQLARTEDLPWIADFRDPFPDWSGHSEVYAPHRAAYRRLEHAILRRADAVIANTDGARSAWLEKFPWLDGKIQVIWNGFDSEERVEPLPIPPREYRFLTHLGHLYKERNATPILESLARLLDAGRLPAGRLRLRLIGTVEPGALPEPEFLARAQSQGWLDLRTEWVGRDEALDIERASEGLLLLQPQSSTQVPGKLFEYLQIGRPILAFVQPNSPSQHLLERSGVAYRCVHPGSTPNEIDEAVADFFKLPSTAVAPSAWFEEHFKAETQTRILASLIRQVQSKLTSPARATSDRVKQAGING
jgi:glycosyltransferase involved in cell wall biosynthesis